MKQQDLLNKTCLIGLTYLNANGDILKQSQLAGTVIKTDEEEGISVQLMATEEQLTTKEQKTKDKKAKLEKPVVFHLPPSLKAWFVAPKGHYKNAEYKINIENPDYFVTWDIVKKKDDAADGQHEWWEWHVRDATPSVN